MSMRGEFEEALVVHLKQMTHNATEKRGGVNLLLNELFYTQSDHPYAGVVAEGLLFRKKLIDKELTSEKVEITLKKIELNPDLKPRWTLGVMFNENEDVLWSWRIDCVTVTIEPDPPHQITYWRFSEDNPWPDDCSEDDPTWDLYRRLVTGETFLKTMDPRL